MKNIIKLILFLFSTLQVFSQTGIGKYAGDFLSLGAGARALGMGGANIAIANDANAGYWNPAGLSNVNYYQFSLMHEEHFGNLVNYNFASIAIPFNDEYTFGVSVLRLAVDGIPDTRNALFDANGDGILDITTDFLDKSKITEFSDADWALFFSASKKINEKINIGANLKLISRAIAEYSAFGIGFDLGLQYKYSSNLILGVTIQDITTTLVAWETGKNELISPTVKLGGAYKIKVGHSVFMPTIDFDVRFENRRFASNYNIGFISFDFHGGMEYSYKNLFSIRAGYNDVKQLTFGAGINFPMIQFDYSFARIAEDTNFRFDDTHRISILITLKNEKYSR